MLQRLILIISLHIFTVFPVFSAEEQSVNGAVASAHPLATKAGLAVLEKGGNAFDAAIAVAATLNVVEPMMSGLGGYGFTLVYVEKNNEIRYLNASGKFPAKANSDLMRAPTPGFMENRKGPLSISTPGNLNAWNEMHKKYGKLPWKNLFEDAIYYANTGFPISPYTAKLIADSFDQFSEYSKSFYSKEGRPLQEGEMLIQKDLAKTYQLIAAKGVDPFYRGEIALLIDKQMKKTGSFLSIEDLRADVAEWWEPIKIKYKGYDVYTMGTPGNGFSALYTLGVMEQFPVQKLQHNSQKYLHILTEVLKESSKVRLTHSGSPEEKSNIVNNLLTTDNFIKVAKSIDSAKASQFDMESGKEGFNTTHFVVVDKWGNIVSSTQTLGTGFGSKVMVEGTGVWMNNSMAFSTFEPKGNPMDVLPGKYKLSSNSPIIIMKQNQPWAALGTPGGHTIPQNVAQIVINLIDFDMGMQAAIDAPKLAFFEESKVVCTEEGVPKPVVSSLKNRGHAIDNEHIASYIGLSGKIGNAMGVKILHNDEGKISFDVGVDKRRDAQLLANAKCFIAKENNTIIRQEGDCKSRYAPESTFKIPLSLMGYDAGILVNETDPQWPFKDDYDFYINVCKGPHNPESWMRDSCVWYSQVMTGKLGMDKFKGYIKKFNYGNQDLSGDKDKDNGLTHAWLSSSLLISPEEQIVFLEKLIKNQLPVSKSAHEMTKKILYKEELPGGWKLYGKTGTGNQFDHNGQKTDLKHGWFVGWIEKNGRSIIFARHIVDDKKQDTVVSFRARDEAKHQLWTIIEELEA